VRELERIRSLATGVEDEFLAPLDAESRGALHDLLMLLAAHNDPCCCPFEGDDSALTSV
jgi:hypothetical protein